MTVHSLVIPLSQFWTSPLFHVWFCCFLTHIQVSQEIGKVVWCSHLLKNFPFCCDSHSQRLYCSQWSRIRCFPWTPLLSPWSTGPSGKSCDGSVFSFLEKPQYCFLQWLHQFTFLSASLYVFNAFKVYIAVFFFSWYLWFYLLFFSSWQKCLVFINLYQISEKTFFSF